MNINTQLRAMEAESASDSSASTSSSTKSTAPSQNDFLMLLVTQLKNQNPMNPTDSTQFMSELAQFSQLQEVIGIHQDLDKLNSAAATSVANS